MKLFKENLPVLGSTVTFICNLSLMTCIFPSELATAIIILKNLSMLCLKEIQQLPLRTIKFA